jgi:flagellar biosynthesis/type III secretory pathway chaperone
MYFQFKDQRIQNLFGPTHDNSNSTLFDGVLRYLFGPTHDNSNSTLVDGVLRSDPKTKASDGARWAHVTDNSFYYNIRLKPQEETYVITGEYMHVAFDTTEKEQIPAHLSRLRSILKDGDASRLIATQNVITLLTRGFEVAAQLDTKQEELQKKNREHDITDEDIRTLAELYDDVGKWIEDVKKAIQESQIVLQRTQLERFENAVATHKKEFDGIIKEMDPSSKTSGRPTKGNESKRRSPPTAGTVEKVKSDVTVLNGPNGLVEQLYLAWLDTDSPTRSPSASIDKKKVVEDLKRFESSILTRARMSAESAGNRPQVRLVLCRRVEWNEWKDERTKETQEEYLPVVRFGK